MFTLKLINSSIRCSRLNHRHISAPSASLNGFFRKDPKPEDNRSELINLEEEVDPEENQKKLEALQNKSRLLPQHRKMLMGEVPYDQAESWIHNTLKYKRKMYGKFGAKSNVDPRLCFWTKEELAEKEEYERVAHPTSVPEMIAIAAKEKEDKSTRILAREEEIAKNLMKLDAWKKDLTSRKEKKETDARVAKDRKDRLIEEVRRHFGYTIDPRDDRFKELLEQKEKEQRKAMKESKRATKEAKMMEKILDGKKKPEKKAESSNNDDEEEDSSKK